MIIPLVPSPATKQSAILMNGKASGVKKMANHVINALTCQSFGEMGDTWPSRILWSETFPQFCILHT